jgi:AcrR family transcriptional regulator
MLGIFTMGIEERKARQREQLRATVLLAAESVAESEGWEAVTMRRLAEEVDYTPPTIYEIFKSKKNLLAELGIKGYNEMLDTFREIDPDLKPAARLKCMAQTYWRFGQEHPALYQIMFGPDIPCPDFVNPPEDGGMFGILCGIVAAMRPKDSPAGIQEIALVVWSTIHGLVDLNVNQYADPAYGNTFVDTLLDRLVEMVTT